MLIRLDLQLFAGEKTEKATPNKRREARKKGQVAKSQEVSSALMLLLIFSYLMLGGTALIKGIMQIFRHSFHEYMLWDFSISSIELLFTQIVVNAAKIAGPILGVAVLAALLSNFAQVGFMFNPESIKFNLGKLNPIQGAKQIFSMRAIVDLCKSILKMVITSAIVYMIAWPQKEQLLVLGEKNLWDAAAFIGALTLKIGMGIAVALGILAAADYLYQKYEFEKKIKMSKQDIKDEFKKMEGDPFIKGQRRAKQRQMSMNRMMQEIPKADVLITNPTHFAIAIRYDFSTMEAPEVIAKGKDHIALKIKEIAREHKIMTVENKPLARALYASVEIGETIPEELFNAVGEILAYVYFQEGRYKGITT
ncbi:flagellar biosynthesis protein FlhB [Bacillus sp. B-jedd]|uniref:flagellar biosynthesis protein FlhB n=1 Tax=Bacillus sp. B-jedd TaxID=1476857 RepID=UPI0005156466|nr:flagellar biosynthesis protein FlhB [Bacillus sp. B-jedd]CEG25926.1 flagellar biosynthetic protein FlhB [Bacillus sp. B-jedd]